MNDRVDAVLRQLKNVDPPQGLNDRIISAVRRDQRKSRIITGLLYAALGIAAPAMLVSLRLLISDISVSPLAPLLDLAVTDWGQVQASFGTWVLAVFEALPVFSLALTLGALFALMVLVNRIVAKGYVKNQHMKEAI